MESNILLIHEKWFKMPNGAVIRYTYRVENGKTKMIAFEITPYREIPFVEVSGVRGGKMESNRIILLDIETAPSLGWIWGKYEQDVIDFKKDWYILSYSYKVLGEKTVHTRGLVDFPGYEIDKENDKQLVEELWKVIDGADIIIGHNLDKFDIRKSNSRFVSHGLPPPTPYKTVDTLKIARKVFKFDSNKLDDLGRYLGLGRKLAHTGFHLWKGCMTGDEKSWGMMKKYNKRDVTLLENVYLLLRPWATNHANINRGEVTCPKCNSRKIQKRGFSYTLLRKKQRYQCLGCKGWWEGSAEKV